MENRVRKALLSYAQVVGLACLMGVNYEIFVFPNAFAPAGINGLATMLQYLLHINIGYLSLLINLPLILLAETVSVPDAAVWTGAADSGPSVAERSPGSGCGCCRGDSAGCPDAVGCSVCSGFRGEAAAVAGVLPSAVVVFTCVDAAGGLPVASAGSGYGSLPVRPLFFF